MPSPIAIGQQVSFDCSDWEDPCPRKPHTGPVEDIYEVTPTLWLVRFTDQHGEQLTVSHHELEGHQA